MPPLQIAEFNAIIPFLEGNGIDVGAGYSPLENTLSIDLAVRGECFCPGAEPSKAVWRADACDLPLKDGVADFVFTSHFLEHVEDRLLEVFREFARVLKPNGYLVSIVPDIRVCRLPDGRPHGLVPVSLPPLLGVAGLSVEQLDTIHNNFTFDLVARKWVA